MGIPSERGDQNTQAAESSYKCRVFSNRVLDMLVANAQLDKLKRVNRMAGDRRFAWCFRRRR